MAQNEKKLEQRIAKLNEDEYQLLGRQASRIHAGMRTQLSRLERSLETELATNSILRGRFGEIATEFNLLIDSIDSISSTEIKKSLGNIYSTLLQCGGKSIRPALPPDSADQAVTVVNVSI